MRKRSPSLSTPTVGRTAAILNVWCPGHVLFCSCSPLSSVFARGRYFISWQVSREVQRRRNNRVEFVIPFVSYWSKMRISKTELFRPHRKKKCETSKRGRFYNPLKRRKKSVSQVSRRRRRRWLTHSAAKDLLSSWVLFCMSIFHVSLVIYVPILWSKGALSCPYPLSFYNSSYSSPR